MAVPRPTLTSAPSTSPTSAYSDRASASRRLGDIGTQPSPVSPYRIARRYCAIGTTTKSAPIPSRSLNSRASSPTVMPCTSGSGYETMVRPPLCSRVTQKGVLIPATPSFTATKKPSEWHYRQQPFEPDHRDLAGESVPPDTCASSGHACFQASNRAGSHLSPAAPIARRISSRLIEDAGFEIFPEMLNPIGFIADWVFPCNLCR